MKYRSGFVSNSSSSSFCIMGFNANKIDEDLFYEWQEKYGSHIAFENGYDCGQCIGLWAENYLENYSINQAKPIVLSDIESRMDKADFDLLVNKCGDIRFIYDYGDDY